MDSIRIDDEHKLIERYTRKLAQQDSNTERHSPGLEPQLQYGSWGNINGEPYISSDLHMHKRLIHQLEEKNRHIMEEILKLKIEKEKMSSTPSLTFELQLLKQHRDELENRMGKLHEGRKDLMEQLDKLMNLLKARDAQCTTHSTLSSPSDQLVTNGAKGMLTKRNYDQITQVSRTKNQFQDLFVAADSVTESFSHLIERVTEHS